MAATGGTDNLASPPGGVLSARTLWRDRGTRTTGALLVIAAALAWVSVVRQATSAMSGMGDTTGMGSVPGGVALDSGVAFVVAWGVMMAAMMLPSATPMILLYRAVGRNMTRKGEQAVPTFVFAAAYLAVWLAVGVPVYLASAAVEYAAQVNQTVAGLLPYALGVILLAAGAYQWTALKRVCLANCQSPLSFLMRSWRGGYGGTLRVGLTHALYCVGCCWGLMAVLVAAGAMGLQWVLLIAAVVFAEKLLPRGGWTARAVGAALIALGVVVIIEPGLAATLRGQGAPPTSI